MSTVTVAPLHSRSWDNVQGWKPVSGKGRMFVFWYFLPLFGQTTSISIMVFTPLWAHASMSDQGTEGASSRGKANNMLGCHEHQDTRSGAGATRTRRSDGRVSRRGAAHIPLEGGDRSSC